MPLKVTSRAGDSDYGSPLLGPANHTAPIAVDITALTDDEIDSEGYLKPGVPFTGAGALVGAAPAFVFGVTIEPQKVADGNAAGDIAGAGTQTVIVATIGQVQRAIAEDNLGRAYTADEIAGFDRAGSKLVLVD